MDGSPTGYYMHLTSGALTLKSQYVANHAENIRTMTRVAPAQFFGLRPSSRQRDSQIYKCWDSDRISNPHGYPNDSLAGRNEISFQVVYSGTFALLLTRFSMPLLPVSSQGNLLCFPLIPGLFPVTTF